MATKTRKADAPKVVAAPASKRMLKIQDVEPGHLFSELSHFMYLRRGTLNGTPVMVFRHMETGTEVSLSPQYVVDNTIAADQYFSEKTVGKEDKLWTQKQVDDFMRDNTRAKVSDPPRVGDIRVKGIRTIWEEIHSSHVFTVCFEKQGKEISQAAYDALRENQINTAIAKIDEAQRRKKGVAQVATDAIKEIQENPVQRWEKGEDRILRGYKVQFTSRDGKYDCVDVDIPEGERNIRPVNINTIKWLVFDGVRYIVE